MSLDASAPHTPAPNRLARKLFWAFLLVGLTPLIGVLALVFIFASAARISLPLWAQQQALAIVAGLVIVLLALAWLLARRFAHAPARLLRQMQLFMDGSWEQRAPVAGRDEINALAALFNCLADDLSEFQHLLMIRDSEETGSQSAAALVAQLSLAAASRDDLLANALELCLRHFNCAFGAVYLLEAGEPAGKTFAVLAHMAGDFSTGDEQALAWGPLARRYAEKRINLDLTPTMDWLVSKAMATRRPQVGPAIVGSVIYEAVLPLMQPGLTGPRIVGALDLLAPTRIKDNRLGPFSTRAVAEMQAAAGVLAAALAAFEDPTPVKTDSPTPAGDALPAQPPTAERAQPSRFGSLRLDDHSIYVVSSRIAQAHTEDQVLEALRQALRTAPYASAVLLRPPEPAEGSALQVMVCRQLRTQRPGMNEPPLVLPGPRLQPTEELFQHNNASPLLLYDLNLPGQEADDDPRPADDLPPELEAIARRMGCRSAAYLPALCDHQIVAVLMIGAAPDVPAPLFRAETLEPFHNLIQLAAVAINRIQSERTTQRKLAEMQTMAHLTQAISIETDLNELLRQLHRQTENVLGELNAFAVGLYDAATETIRIPYMIEAGQTLHVPAFPLGEGLSSEVIHTRQPLLLSTAEEVQKHSLEIGARQIGDPAQSWLGVPILYGGEPLGLIIVQDTQRDGRFKPEDAQLLTTLASQVAVVIRNVRLLETSRRQMRQERLVNEINARIRRAVDVHSILKTTADELGLALGARRAAIHIRPPEMAAGTAAAPAPPSEAEPPPHAGPHASPTGEEPA